MKKILKNFNNLQTKIIAIGGVLVLAIILVLVLFKPAEPELSYEIEQPEFYSQPLVIKTFKNIFAVQPVNAQENSKKIKEGKDKVKYINAYQNTDIVQTLSKNKIKEDIILKQAGHPDKFEYTLELEKYDYEKDDNGNFIFYTKGHLGEELYKSFTIPAPYLIDAQGEESHSKFVQTKIAGDILTLIPNQEWLDNHEYPIILDPSIEIDLISANSVSQEGDLWKVKFKTNGQADLKIIPDYDEEELGLEFISLQCGDKTLTPDKIIDEQIFYSNYLCNDSDGLTELIYKVKSLGPHNLRFEFGDLITYAYNDFWKEGNEVIGKRDLTSKTYYLGGNKYVWEGITGPQHYEDEVGQWQEINAEIKASTDAEYDYSNIENNFYSFFKKDIQELNPIKFQKDDAYVIFEPVDNELGNIQNIQGYAENNAFYYPNAYPQVDIKYSISNKRLLEEYIFSDYERVENINKISQKIKINNVDLVLENDGSIGFYQSNELLWEFPHPYMYEQVDKSTVSYDLYYEIENLGNNEYLITKVLTAEGKEWLADPLRIYPLIIDDTADLNNPTEDGFVDDGGSRNNNTNDVYIGYNSWLDPIVYRGYVEWDVSSISDEATISDTDFQYHGHLHDIDAHIHEMLGTRPSTGGNADVYNEIGEGTIYADVAGFSVVGTGQEIDLGTSADEELASQLSSNWFAIGLQSDNESSWNWNITAIYAEEYSSVNPAPTLYVTYTSTTVPTVTTQSASSVNTTTVTANGNITDTGGATVTARGFRYGLTEADTWEEAEGGSFSTGSFNLEIGSLTKGTTYYFRAFATNSEGTAYGAYVPFVTGVEAHPVIFKENSIFKENVIFK